MIEGRVSKHELRKQMERKGNWRSEGNDLGSAKGIKVLLKHRKQYLPALCIGEEYVLNSEELRWGKFFVLHLLCTQMISRDKTCCLFAKSDMRCGGNTHQTP